VLYLSLEVRDMVLKTGMARDAALSQDSLEVAKELQKQHASRTD
jgi:hypothetical protein